MSNGTALTSPRMGASVEQGGVAARPDTSDLPAAAAVTEPDPTEHVASVSVGVVAADRETLYSHSVEHVSNFSPADSASRKGRSRGDAVATSAVTQRPEARIGQERAMLSQKPGTAGGVGLTCSTHATDAAESFRLARLSRWQEQR